MYPRPSAVSIRLSAPQAETIYWELLGILDHYRSKKIALEIDDEGALLSTITQLEVGIKHCEAIANVRLDQLRRAFTDAQQQRKSDSTEQEDA